MQLNNKLREALEALLDVVRDWDDHIPPAIREGELQEAYCKAEAALDAPPKNCDRFATVKDAAIAFARERQDAPQPSPDFTFSAWLLAPASEKKGGNDGR